MRSNRGALRLLNLRRLRDQPGRTLLAVVAVGAGIALSVGVVIARDSVDRSSAGFSHAISGAATLRVESRVDHGSLDASLLPTIRSVTGVLSAVPLVSAVTTVTDDHGAKILVPAIGVDCTIEAAISKGPCQPERLAALGDVPITSPRLARLLGQGGAVHTDTGTTSLRGAPTLSSLDAVNDGRVLVYDLGVSQRLFARPDGYDSVLIVPVPGVPTALLRHNLAVAMGPQHRVLDISAPLARSTAAAVLLPFLFLFSLLGLMIGAQVIHATVDLALEERRREMATASALGQTPNGQLLGVMAEAVIVGVAGGVVGVAAGVIIADAFVANLSIQVSRASGLHLSARVTPGVVAIGIVISTVLCILASLGPARRASRADLVAELTGRTQHAPQVSLGRWRLLATVGVAVAASTVSWFAQRGGSIQPWQPPALLLGALIVAVVTLRLPGQLAPIALGRLRSVPGFRTGPARIAIDSLVSTPRRTRTVVIAVTAPIALAVTLGSTVPAIGIAAHRFARHTSPGRVFASTLGTNNTAAIDSKVPPDLQRRIAALPGVSSVDHVYFATVDDPTGGRIELDATDGAPPDYRVYQGERGPDALGRGHVMIGPRLAGALRARAGDLITIPGRHGMVTLKVGGIWAAPAGVGISIETTTDQLLTIAGTRPTDRLDLVPKAGIGPAQLASQVRDAHLDSRLIALSPDQLGSDFSREFRSFLSPFWVLQRGTLLVALVATASALLLTGIQRRREQAMLAAVGMGPLDLARMTVIEAGLIGLTATVLGGVTAQLALLCTTWASATATGLPLPYKPQLGVVVVAGLAATLITVIGAALPAWRTSRLDPVLALREE